MGEQIVQDFFFMGTAPFHPCSLSICICMRLPVLSLDRTLLPLPLCFSSAPFLLLFCTHYPKPRLNSSPSSFPALWKQMLFQCWSLRDVYLVC